MTRDHETVVTEQFGPRAAAYVESAVHARGEDLDALEAIVRAVSPTHALDLGTGGGHAAYRMAPHAARVTASDLSAEMLAAVVATAQGRALTNIEIVEASAERLPFPDAAFDFLSCRYSAHHWRDFDGGLREARRVMQVEAPAIFIDTYAPSHALLDTHLQAIELLRDTSHVRDRTLSEWLAALGSAGFRVAAAHTRRRRMDFPTWTARMGTPDVYAKAIRALQEAAGTEVRRHFAIEADGSFMLDVMMIESVAQ